MYSFKKQVKKKIKRLKYQEHLASIGFYKERVYASGIRVGTNAVVHTSVLRLGRNKKSRVQITYLDPTLTVFVQFMQQHF